VTFESLEYFPCGESVNYKAEKVECESLLRLSVLIK
jgi:hypothetical protein